MNKFKNIMALQGLVIVFIFLVIIFIAYNNQDKEYLAYSKEIKSACEKFLSDNKVQLKYNETTVIFMKDLLDGEYIKENKEKYCITSVIYTKGLILGKYKANKDCNVIDKNDTVENKTEENVTEENKSIEE